MHAAAAHSSREPRKLSCRASLFAKPFERVFLAGVAPGSFAFDVRKQTAVTEIPVSVNQLVAFPNPFQMELQIMFNGSPGEEVNLTVANLLGQVLMQQKYTGQMPMRKNLDLSHLQSGIYFVHIKQGDHVISRKIVKE